ncbi:MAG: OmpA family protein [Bacteroidales bacterium]|nr:OmpA family protein [Bacteroidales bacterium]
MNLKKFLFVAGLALTSCFAAKAQEEVQTDYVFNPNWYLQIQGGAQYTLGEVDFSDLLSPNIQVAVGYNWTAIWGARLAVDFWQSKGGLKFTRLSNSIETYNYKWNYIAPTLDVTFDLTNAIYGFNPKRVVSVGLLAGIGANIGFNNDQAKDARAAFYGKHPDANPNDVNLMEYLWSGSNCFFVGKFGANVDFRVSDRVKIGLEFNANTLSDHYNSKKANNLDWYFNGLAGVKIALGKTYTTRTREVPPCDPVYIEKPVYVHDTVTIDKTPAPEGPIRRDIFYQIRRSNVTETELPKLEEVVAYLYRHPEAKVTVTSYADMGTGNARINKRYSESRMKKVVKMLTENYGINPSRITSDAKGDTVQPFAENDLNRVTICIAE